uniref:HAD hydrolase family protein n=1 Tax=Staphylococcus saprophyticus TaxID=29385 RepID=UPI003703EEFC
GKEMINLIGRDMDGRLVNGGDEIWEENIKGIKYGEWEGIRVVIARGGAFYEGNCGVNERDLKVGYIWLNGGEVRDE